MLLVAKSAVYLPPRQWDSLLDGYGTVDVLSMRYFVVCALVWRSTGNAGAWSNQRTTNPKLARTRDALLHAVYGKPWGVRRMKPARNPRRGKWGPRAGRHRAPHARPKLSPTPEVCVLSPEASPTSRAVGSDATVAPEGVVAGSGSGQPQPTRTVKVVSFSADEPQVKLIEPIAVLVRAGNGARARLAADRAGAEPSSPMAPSVTLPPAPMRVNVSVGGKGSRAKLVVVKPAMDLNAFCKLCCNKSGIKLKKLQALVVKRTGARVAGADTWRTQLQQDDTVTVWKVGEKIPDKQQ